MIAVMTVSSILSHPLVVSLIVFSLAQGAGLMAAVWRISTAVRLGSETDEHLKELIVGNTRRIERLEDGERGTNNNRH